MPIEIKELVIKMTVSENKTIKSKASGEFSKTIQKQIVQECIEQVLEKLESKLER